MSKRDKRDKSIFQGMREFEIGGTTVRCELSGSGRGRQPIKVFLKIGNAFVFDRTIISKPNCDAIESAYLLALMDKNIEDIEFEDDFDDEES